MDGIQGEPFNEVALCNQLEKEHEEKVPTAPKSKRTFKYHFVRCEAIRKAILHTSEQV